MQLFGYKTLKLRKKQNKKSGHCKVFGCNFVKQNLKLTDNQPGLNSLITNLIDNSLWLAEPSQRQPFSAETPSQILREKEEHVTTDQPFVKGRVAR